MDRAASRIEISRAPGGYTDRGRAYQVLVDERAAGELRTGESLAVDVPAGKHGVQLRIDWCRSPTLELELELAPGRGCASPAAPTRPR